MRNHRFFSVLFIDVDHFKLINDEYGHAVGDQLLVDLAKALKVNLRQEDEIGRLGGDEFAVILTAVKSQEDAGAVAEKLINKIQLIKVNSDEAKPITVSIGIACYPGKVGSLENLLQQADIALYRAKEAGRNNFQYYSEMLHRRYHERVELEMALRKALMNNEFYLVYQPIFSLQTKKIVGLETLLRWKNKTIGEIPPDKFVPVAEKSGLILDIGKWVVEMACEQYAMWKPTLVGLQQVPISVNLSIKQFTKDNNIFSFILGCAKKNNLDLKCIEVEIKETVLLEGIRTRGGEILHCLANLPIKLVIDDFGAGFSSLNLLKKLPISTLKIGRNFIDDLVENKDHQTMVKSIIDLGRGLGIQVVAEGIETEAQLAFLMRNLCESAQGFYFSKPLPIEALAKKFEAKKS